MRKIVFGALAALSLVSSAQADEYWNHRHGAPMYGRFPERHYDRGNGNWVAPLVGGMILGGVIESMAQPRYYEPQCQRVYVGDVFIEGRWVQAFRNVCQ